MKVLTFIACCLLTLFFGQTVKHYLPTGGQILSNNDFSVGLANWAGVKEAVAVSDEGGVVLHSRDATKSVQLSQNVPLSQAGQRVVLRAQLKATQIVQGEQGWQLGRVIIAQYAQGKGIYTVPHVLAALKGTSDWLEYRLVTSILPETTEIRVAIQLVRCTGELQVKDLTLFQAVTNPRYHWAGSIVIVLWMSFFFFVFRHYFVSTGGTIVLPVVLGVVLAAIVFGTTMPASMKNAAKHQIASYARHYAQDVIQSHPGNGDEQGGDVLMVHGWKIDITKVAHFLLFGLLGGLLFVRRGPRSYWPGLSRFGHACL